MIVFFGYGDDAPLERALAAAAALEVDHVLLDQKACAGVDLLLADDGGTLWVDGRVIPLDEITAAYARPLSPLPDADARAAERGQALFDRVVEWLDTTAARVVNRPYDMHSNSSKPYQAQLIARAGFAVPETLISSDPEEVRDFLAAHDAVIFKSISGIRSIVRRLDERYVQRLDRVRTVPTQFQVLEPGVDVRVHVVGAAVFATRIETSATDYRYAAREGGFADLTATELPDDVAERCVALAAALHLPLAGIDLRRRPDGSYVCFEVNPMPGYSYFESHTGQPISRALVSLLAAA